MITGCVPDNKRSINGYHSMSNGLVPDKTEMQRMRTGQNVLPKSKGSFMLVYYFQPVRHSIVPSFCQSAIPSMFNVFFCNIRNVCPILFKFSQHYNHQTMRVWWKNRG